MLTGGEDPDTLVAKGGPAAFEAVLAGAKPLSAALYDLLAGATPPATPEQRAAFRNRLDAAAKSIPDKALSSEYRRAWLDRFFAEGRSARPASAPRPAWTPRGKPGELVSIRGLQRTAIDQEAIKLERARNLLAILLHHPALLPEVEEALAALELPAGDCTQLREALLAWLPGADHLDSMKLMDHLREAGRETAASWATRKRGLSQAADPGAQPKEALEAWWHFFGLLRGEAELIEDRAEAERMLVATNDPVAQQRLISLNKALDALRRGEADEPAESGTI
jgi:DNA primase